VYNKVDREVLEELEKIVGPENMLIDRETMVDYSHDEFSLSDISEFPEVVIKPASARETGEVLRLANERNIPVTPRGGASGLCGGCVPTFGGILLSMEKMNRILEVDIANQMAVVEAGVRLMDFYEAVEET
jgi:glycolate oxidase